MNGFPTAVEADQETLLQLTPTSTASAVTAFGDQCRRTVRALHVHVDASTPLLID